MDCAIHFSEKTEELTVENAPELAQLKDIHLPEPIHWWPLAWGWYVVIAVVLVIIITIAGFIYRKYQRERAKREALRLLAQYEREFKKEKNKQKTSARISELLKRVALVYYPRERVAALKGEQWVSFLEETSKNADFLKVKRELIELPYRFAKDNGDILLLFKQARAWIMERSKPCLN